MAYRVKPKDPGAGASLRRIARTQVTAALRSIDTAGGDVGAAIHDVRKRCKKIRGLLRLVRPAFDDYRAENAAFRDIAATLGPIRDAEVLIAAFDHVAASIDSEEAPAFEPIREQLRTRRGRLADAQDPRLLLQAARSPLHAALQRIQGWKLAGKHFDAFEAGLESGYRRGRKAMRAACRNGDDEAFHTWRKRCKDHGFHLRLLGPIWPGPMRAERDCADELGELLGLHHDLAVLAAHVGGMDPADFGMADAFIAQLRTCQHALAKRAGALGARLYALPPAALAKSWRRRHRAWRRQRDAPPPAAGAH